MNRTLKCYLCTLLSTLVVLISFNRCGSDSSSGLGNSLSSLSQIPGAETMVAASSSSISLPNISSFVKGAINLQSVSGTAPNLKDLTSTNAETYFFNGLVQTLITAGSATAGQRNQFWGQDTSTPGPGGHGACFMAQSTGEALSRMLGSTSTMCYMKGIGSAASGVTVTGATQSTAFTQGAADKVVKVSVSNMPQDRGNRESMDVFFRIKGTNTVTSNIYKYEMWMCRSGSANSVETLEVNKSTGLMTATQSDSNGGSTGNSTITAYLTVSNGAITFDNTQNREMNSIYQGSWGTYKGNLIVTGANVIKGKRYGSSSWGVNKSYSLAAFSGSGIDDFKFLQAAYKGTSTDNNRSRSRSRNSNTYSGITEFRDTYYAAVASSDLSTEANAYTMGTDTFFTSITAPTFSTSESCTATADVTMTMDFSDAAVDAIKDECDGESRKLSNYDMCNSSRVQQAMQYTWN